MENNTNKRSVKFQGDMLNFCDFIQVFVFTRNHHLKLAVFTITVYVNIIVDIYLFIDWFISESVLGFAAIRDWAKINGLWD